jgi:DNA-binding GntR family transcriptional regulator
MASEDDRESARTLDVARRDRERLAAPRGDKSNEVHISSAMGVSRGTLQEAMRLLEQEGLLRSVPHGGTSYAELTPARRGNSSGLCLALEIATVVHDALSWSPEIEAWSERCPRVDINVDERSTQ